MTDGGIGLVRDLCARYRNWNQWGEEDQAGAANFTTADHIRRAAQSVRSGTVISCALPYDSNGPQTGVRGRVNPQHIMLLDGGDIAIGAEDWIPGIRATDDAVYMPLQCGTQWDALSHIFFDGAMFNGHGPEKVDSGGARVNGVEHLADKLVGRGVLLDIPRHRGVDWLSPGEGIGADELDACASAEGVTVGEGDILLVRTGHLALVRARGEWGDYAGGDAPGLNLSSVDWLCPRRIAAVATDTWGVEVRPNEVSDVFQPLHAILLVNAGIILGEMFDLEGLAAACADDGRWDCLFVAPPLPFTGAVGAPLNPVAIR